MSELKTCFKKVDYDLSGLLHYIEIGDIALPDIQRPFVWSNAKVRDLFDSMYRGFPVGYFLFWENVTAGGTKQIGVGSKQHTVARLLIVDGQQRLTSLFAVFRGRKVLDEDYKERQIEVAFRPRDGKFEVAGQPNGVTSRLSTNEREQPKGARGPRRGARRSDRMNTRDFHPRCRKLRRVPFGYSLRDTLLPTLLSGELSLPAAMLAAQTDVAAASGNKALSS